VLKFALNGQNENSSLEEKYVALWLFMVRDGRKKYLHKN
jgi:hypothetical protein